MLVTLEVQVHPRRNQAEMLKDIAMLLADVGKKLWSQERASSREIFL